MDLPPVPEGTEPPCHPCAWQHDCPGECWQARLYREEREAQESDTPDLWPPWMHETRQP